MTDLLLGMAWLAVLGTGLAACVLVRTLGLAATYVRDMLHIGASVWLLGWPHWNGQVVPIAIVAFAALVTAVLPHVHNRFAARIVHSVTNGDEHWTGLVHYTLSYAVFTTVGLLGQPWPAAAALLALSLGDGIGGAVGRNLGRHHFQLPGAKRKSLEGSLVVAIAAASGALIAAQLLGVTISLATAAVLGVVAAVTEAIAPRSTDNLLIPIAVWTTATIVT